MSQPLSRIQIASKQATGVCAEPGLHPPARPAGQRMAARVRGLKTKPEVIAKLGSALGVTKKEAAFIAGSVVDALEETLIAHIGEDGFYIKLGSFGKFSIRH